MDFVEILLKIVKYTMNVVQRLDNSIEEAGISKVCQTTSSSMQMGSIQWSQKRILKQKKTVQIRFILKLWKKWHIEAKYFFDFERFWAQYKGMVITVDVVQFRANSIYDRQ